MRKLPCILLNNFINFSGNYAHVQIIKYGAQIANL